MVSATLMVEAVLVADRPGTFVSVRRPEIELDFAGVIGDRHYGITAPASAREARCYPRGTEIRNRRQVSLVSVEECAEIARLLGVPVVAPEDLGANLLLAGDPNLSGLQPGTRLLFPSGAGLVCETINQPCRLPGRVLQDRHPDVSGLVRAFLRAAYDRRGIVASVERPGPISAGDSLRLMAPLRSPGARAAGGVAVQAR